MHGLLRLQLGGLQLVQVAGELVELVQHGGQLVGALDLHRPEDHPQHERVHPGPEQVLEHGLAGDRRDPEVGERHGQVVCARQQVGHGVELVGQAPPDLLAGRLAHHGDHVSPKG